MADFGTAPAHARETDQTHLSVPLPALAGSVAPVGACGAPACADCVRSLQSGRTVRPFAPAHATPTPGTRGVMPMCVGLASTRLHPAGCAEGLPAGYGGAWSTRTRRGCPTRTQRGLACPDPGCRYRRGMGCVTLVAFPGSSIKAPCVLTRLVWPSISSSSCRSTRVSSRFAPSASFFAEPMEEPALVEPPVFGSNTLEPKQRYEGMLMGADEAEQVPTSVDEHLVRFGG